MKLIPRSSLSFKKLKPAVKVSFGSNVINSLTPPPVSKAEAKEKSKEKENLILSDLPISVSELMAINTELAKAVADARTGNHTAKASLKNTIIEWNNAFGVTANYISSVADGDVVIIREAGFEPTKGESQPKQKPGAISNFKATINGSKGAILAGAKTAVPSAIAYLFSAVPEGVDVSYADNVMILTIGDKTIYITADTRRQTEIYNLSSGVPFNVSMLAINSAGSGPAAVSHQVIPQ